MNDPRVEINIIKARRLSPLQGYRANSVIISVNTKSDEIVENPITVDRTLTRRSTRVGKLVVVNINIRSSSHGYIVQLLRNKLVNHHWLCVDLASKVSTAATELGNGFTLTISVKVTYQTLVSAVPALSLRAVLLRLVLLGRIGREEPKMETEPCSICLDNLSGSSSKHGVPTRMTCSHFFHERCLLEWLHRKNTCPLCRTVLYDR